MPLVAALPALLLPFLIRAAVVEGVATATEVSTIGIAYALAYGVLAAILFREQVDGRRLWPALVETACLSGAILLIIGTATGMAWALTQSGFSRQLAAAMTGLPGGAVGFMAVSIVAFVILGSRARGHPGDRAVRAAALPDRQARRHPRGALRDGRDPRDGDRALRAALRRRLLRGLRHRPGRSAEGMKPIWPYMLALLIGTSWSRGALDFDRLPEVNERSKT